MKNLTNFHKSIQTLELVDYEFYEKSRNTVGRAGSLGSTLEIFILSCPDYSSNGQEYTFGQLGDGVPLLAKLHIEGIEPLIQLCQNENIKANVEVLIADVEALNSTLVQAYTNSDEELYKKRCERSVIATQEYLDDLSNKYDIVNFKASSFLRRFEPDQQVSYNPSESVFLKTRQHYIKSIKKLLGTNHSLANKVLNNVRAKANSNYYQAEYAGLLKNKDLRIEQELTTMAEYLALGKLIGCLLTSNLQPILVTHDTANVHLFNSINRIDIAAENVGPEVPAVPLAIYKRSVIADE